MRRPLIVSLKMNLIKYNESLSQELFVASTENHVLYTTSRDIAEKTQKRHDNVMRDIDKLLANDSTGVYKLCFQETKYIDSFNREQRQYIISNEGAFLYFGNMSGQNGQEWQLKYLLAFKTAQKALQNALNRMAMMPELGSAEYFAQALLMANSTMQRYQTELQEKQDLIDKQINQLRVDAVQIQNQVGQIQAQHNQIHQQNIKLQEQNKQISQMTPLAELGKAVGGCDEGVLVKVLATYITQYARQNGFPNFCIGGNNLMKWLRVNKYIYLSGKTNLPMQRYVDAGYFTITTTVVTKTTPHQRLTTHVTGKGQEYFINKIMELLNDGHDVIAELKAVKI